MKQSSFRKSILCQQNVCFTRPAVQKCKDIQVTSQTLQVKTLNLEVFCIFAWKWLKQSLIIRRAGDYFLSNSLLNYYFLSVCTYSDETTDLSSG